MALFGEVIDEVISKLSGHSMTGDRLATLTGDIAVGDLQLTVDDATGFSRGLVEVDQEIMYVSSYDTTSNTLAVPPWGRGYRGTVEATHDTGAMVSVSPSWPRFSVAREINNQITALYPGLFAVASTEFTTDGVAYQYDGSLPAERIVDVRWFFIKTYGWQRATQWELDHTLVTTGSTRFNVYDPLPPGTTLQVLYATRPSTLADESSPWTNTGLTDSVKDLVVLGTIAQMAQFIDVSRLPVLAAETDSQAGGKQLGSAFQVANQLRQQYQQRLAQEQAALYQKYPLRLHKVR